MDTYLCPKGHASIDHDYCSECGAKIGNGKANGAAHGTTAMPVAGADAEVCPDCGTKREHKGVTFCEICGYNFMTGARGEVPVEVAPLRVAEAMEAARPPVEIEPEPVEPDWAVVVSVDPATPQPDSPDPPADFVSFTVALSKPVHLVGRTSQTRAIFPEIALDHDAAVSHRHALLQFDAASGLVVRDIGAANGTRVNGNEIEAMKDHPLKDGDEITLGHWSKITVTKITATWVPVPEIDAKAAT